MQKEERNYTAVADNGVAIFNFDFVSTHRADSKANKNDALKQYKRTHCKSATRDLKILSTYLNN